MHIETISARRAVDNAFLQESITKTEFETFRRRLLQLLNQADEAVQDGESEEHLKGLIRPFLNYTNFEEKYYINTKKDQDLAIYNGKSKKSDVGVIIEAKKPSNRSQMITKEDVNKKGFQQSIFYYLRERIDNGNEDIKYVIVTDIYNWFIFDGQDFERHFYESKKLRGWYQEWKQGQKVSSRTQFVYDHLSEFIDGLDITIKATKLNVKKYRKLLEKEDLSRDEQKKMVPVFKFFTPTHLLKLPFASDSNELNKAFYRELLYIMGLKEYKEKGTHYITRLDKENRQHASLIENTIIQLKSLNVLSQLPNRKEYGQNEDDQLFNVAIQLLITWINRILFLKLLEAQLYKYHQEDDRFRFLNHRDIKEYDGLNKLFFQVLAIPGDERSDRINSDFGHIPYLNSSLFDVADIERQTIRISELEDGLQMPVHSQSKIRNREGKRLKGEKISALEYLLRFLDAYNFNTEGTAEVQEETKTLINASVLGRIFEKINGYKDGSFFTPGYITEYMCRETIRRSVVEKFNDTFENWDCEDIQGVAGKISRHEVPYKEANEIVNSTTICDPAVGSGHFLVSALNELIAIKSDLRIFVDESNQRLRDVDISVDNDELSIAVGQDPFFEYRVHPTWKDNKIIDRTVGTDTQRLQKALFREKNVLIENCLFGVDINPNSANICRLRLWIELLKHAYYKEETGFKELEVLPNIDINIKQGNSLVSRFDLDADLSHILANNDDLTIAEYKQAVRDYKETGDREHKRGLKEQITSIKDSFRVGLEELHPVRQDLKKQKEILIREETKLDLFEGDKKSKKEQKKIKKAERKIEKLEEELAELESATFYGQAFEWRFEFPEVLDEGGNFAGFDAVIGNPPYLLVQNLNNDKIYDYFKEHYETASYKVDLFALFIEKSLNLLKNHSLGSLIVPYTWLSINQHENLRKKLLENRLIKIVDLPKKVFESSDLDTTIVLFQKDLKTNKIEVGKSKDGNIISNRAISSEMVKGNSGLQINLSVSVDDNRILENIESNAVELDSIFEVSQGYIPYRRSDLVKEFGEGKGNRIVDERLWHSKEKKNNKYSPEIQGRDLQRYLCSDVNVKKFIKYGDHVAGYVKEKYFKNPRVLIMEITRGDFYRITATYIEEEYYNTPSIINVIHPGNNKDQVKYLAGLLNSRLFTWYHEKRHSKSHAKTSIPKILVSEVRNLPLVEDCNDDIVTKVNEIIDTRRENKKANTIKLEQEIDQIIYELYGLSEEEIRIVEENT